MLKSCGLFGVPVMEGLDYSLPEHQWDFLAGFDYVLCHVPLFLFCAHVCSFPPPHTCSLCPINCSPYLYRLSCVYHFAKTCVFVCCQVSWFPVCFSAAMSSLLFASFL